MDVVAARIARLALHEAPGLGRVGPGPVLTVVRNTQTGKIYVGLNTGVPKELSDALYKAILDQQGRIWTGEVVLVRTAADAVGGHSDEIERPDQARHARHHLAAHLLQHGFDVERHQRFVFDHEDLQRAGVGHAFSNARP